MSKTNIDVYVYEKATNPEWVLTFLFPLNDDTMSLVDLSAPPALLQNIQDEHFVHMLQQFSSSIRWCHKYHKSHFRHPIKKERDKERREKNTLKKKILYLLYIYILLLIQI